MTFPANCPTNSSNENIGPHTLPSFPGTYVLVLDSTGYLGIQIGRWGLLETCPGTYLYVGSAFGPGGLRARISRHAKTKKAKHWHIDYLRETVHLKHVIRTPATA